MTKRKNRGIQDGRRWISPLDSYSIGFAFPKCNRDISILSQFRFINFGLGMFQERFRCWQNGKVTPLNLVPKLRKERNDPFDFITRYNVERIPIFLLAHETQFATICNAHVTERLISTINGSWIFASSTGGGGGIIEPYRKIGRVGGRSTEAKIISFSINKENQSWFLALYSRRNSGNVSPSMLHFWQSIPTHHSSSNLVGSFTSCHSISIVFDFLLKTKKKKQ